MEHSVNSNPFGMLQGKMFPVPLNRVPYSN